MKFALQLICATAIAPCVLVAQQGEIPEAPAIKLDAKVVPPPSPAQMQASSSQANASSAPRLTLADAEQMAQQHNPDISVAHLLALGQAQVTREVQSAELPTATGSLTAVGSHAYSRITAGAINNPSIYDRAAGGLSVRQLITDFGRTHHLVQSAKESAAAQMENERATRQDIALAVDQAFYQTLTAQAVLKVAAETVAERQTTVDEVSALTKSKLRSTLDLSFAQVQLSQAQLMQIDAQNAVDAAFANLNAILGAETDQRFELVDPTPSAPVAAPLDAEAMVRTAYQARPDLISAMDAATAAKQYSTAERELWMPTVSALAVAGGTPVRDDQIKSNWYGAAGANVNIPIFNGFLFNARANEAKMQAGAAEERVRSLRDVIARDVRTAVLNARSAFQRIGVTEQMLNQANMSLDLAQTRYKLGLSGIVELSQAQLAQTQAQIAYANARFAYQTELAVLRFQTGQ
ncbi:MAG: TolC family protein [Acidobacteriota bacterium]|nr:TolC family protein [Acidobacteriota bacterium]